MTALDRSTWCILRTKSQQTLALRRSLGEAGFEVWAPGRTIKRPAPGQRRQLHMGQRRRMIEVEVAILPGFVFAEASQLHDLIREAADPVSNHPSFTIFQFGDQVPVVGEASIAGIREEEARARAAHQVLLDAEVREAARLERVAHLRTEAQRRKARRSERKSFAKGDRVVVDMPALAGMVGTIAVATDGPSAEVKFGGLLTMKVEAWRVLPVVVEAASPDG